MAVTSVLEYKLADYSVSYLLPSTQSARFRRNVIELKSRNQRLGLNINPKTPVPSWLGERMDYSITVEGLLRAETEHLRYNVYIAYKEAPTQ